jgi:hypothetical protein
MPTQVTIHPTAKIALVAVLTSVFVGGGIVGLKRLLSPKETHLEAPASALTVTQVGTLNEYLLPVIDLPISADAPESHWSEALAAVLGGQTEVATQYGRVDVMTDRFAIEVDRLAKWHEAIGQASHYSHTSNKRAAAAIIILPTDSLEKIPLIEETCLSKGIKLILLQTK